MRTVQAALLGRACVLVLLTGCNFDAPSSISNGSAILSEAGSGPASTGTGGGSSTDPGLSVGGGSTPSPDAVSATASVGGTVSVITGASQTMTVAFTSVDGRPISGLALSGTTLPSDWSGPKNFSCTVTGSGNNCVLTLTYAPISIETGTLRIGYVYVGDQIAPPGAAISIPYAATASNNVVATPTPIGQINAASGTGSRSVSVNFTTDDGNAATGLTMSSDLASLPAGWSSTTPGFSCAIISNGSGCQLVLNYSPGASGSGTLTLAYGYTDHSGIARTGAVNLPYSTTANGNVVATVSPAGQINAIQKAGSQPVTITFTTDDGKAASDFVLLSPGSSLPADWSGSTGGFGCGKVSTGNACQLSLRYAPTSLTNGTVELSYAYISTAGAFTTGSLNIPYAATTNDNLIATAAPSGQIDAVVGEPASTLEVAFTTDDGRTATAVQLTSDPTMLPAGWSSTDSAFTCAGVAGGTGCELPLSYAPTGADSGTLTLRYTYLNNSGQSKAGSLNVPYRATTDDKVLATATPGSISVASGTTTMVAIRFVTDDGNPASALSITSGLTALPAGWGSADNTFACSSVSAGGVCQLALTYQPTNPDSGTVTLGFTYSNNAGSMKTGTVLVPYTATP